MGYAGTRIMCDADSHIMETFDWLADHADPESARFHPPLKLGGAGRLAEKAIANALERRKDPSKAAELRANIIGGAKGWGRLWRFRSGGAAHRARRSGLSLPARVPDLRADAVPRREGPDR